MNPSACDCRLAGEVKVTEALILAVTVSVKLWFPIAGECEKCDVNMYIYIWYMYEHTCEVNMKQI